MDNRFLFRGKRVDNGEWVIGYHFRHDDGKCFIYVPYIRTFDTFEVDPATVGQCTGLSAAKSYRGDKPEDLLVFEGDIVRRKCSIYKLAVRKPIGERLVIGTVFWDEHKKLEAGGWAVKANDEHGNSTTYVLLADSEIIGTVHDLDSPDKREG